MHGTQHRAASGEEGVVYTWGTRCGQLAKYNNVRNLTYVGIRIRGSDECQSIGRVTHTIFNVDSERGKLEVKKS